MEEPVLCYNRGENFYNKEVDLLNTIELLAPAGSMDSLLMAVQNGADAVYLGGTKFSARAYASNFTEEELEGAVDYCHAYGVLVNITLNTLLKDNELDEAVAYAKFLYQIGVDALIVQDTGLIYRLNRELPDFPLHASTQLSIHQGDAALYFTEKGITRVVLARELSLEEIRHISLDLGIETEMFIHGALCISYSGQCLMSSILGGRSGNRGRCAQPCRLPYALLNEAKEEKAKAYLMSPKDISYIDHIDEIKKSGVSSLKIEGRMKRPEYVAATVRSFREELSGLKKESHKHDLLKVFNREGFSEGYLHGKLGRDLMAFNYPKNTGVPIGQVLSDGRLVLTNDLHKGDGLRVGEKGLTVEGILKGTQVVDTAAPGDTIRLTGRSSLPAGQLFKTFDSLYMNELKGSYHGRYDKKIPIKAYLIFKPEEQAVLKASYENRDYEAKTEALVETPLKAPLTLARVEEALEKSGDTPFVIAELIPTQFYEGFLPVKELNKLRRDLLQSIEDYEVKSKKRTLPKFVIKEGLIAQKKVDSLKLVTIATHEQLKACLQVGIKDIAIHPFYRGEKYLTFKDVEKLMIEHPDLNIYLKVSNILRGEFSAVVKKIRALSTKGTLAGLITNHGGIIRALAKEYKILGDYKLNLFNSDALKFYGDDLYMAMVSEELTRKEIKDLKGKENMMALVYGRQELMHSEYCPIGATVGNMRKGQPCNEACMTQSFTLLDRMNEEFPIMTDVFCRSYILNGKPKNLLDTTKDLSSIGINSYRVDLTTETFEEAVLILKAFKNEEALPLDSFNRGHYKRGVE